MAPKVDGLTFTDLFDLHYDWLSEPAFSGSEEFLTLPTQPGARPGLLERLHALVTGQQERDLGDDAHAEV